MTLVRGTGGVFNVSFDNERIFSKGQTHRFPMPGEVEETIRRRLEPATG